ncbi:fimbrial protein [Salmonella enterica]
MKKMFLATIVCTSLGVITPALAAGVGNQGTLHFVGTVSTTTCDLTPNVNGVTGNDTIALGQMTATDSSGMEVNVTLAPANPSAPGCASLMGTNGAKILWTAPQGFNNAGLTSNGSATNMAVKLTAVSGTGTDGHPAITGGSDMQVNSSDQEISYEKLPAGTGGTNPVAFTGFQYKASMMRLDPGAAPSAGSVSADATYTVTYL